MLDDAALLVRCAGLIGRHALPVFFVLLALCLAAATAVWRALQKFAVPDTRRAAPPIGVLGARLAAGFAVIVSGAWVFAELAEQLVADGSMGRADQALTDALLASVAQPALRGFAALTHLADTATLTGLCVVVATALIASGRRWLAFAWVVAVAGNGVLNQTLKQVFVRIRPLHDGGLVRADGFSFPSGHSSGAVVAYGMLAYVALRLLPVRWHLPVVLAAVALAFTVGASRVFLRVHFASDVMAGFASGAAWLAVCIASVEFTRWVRHRPGSA
jgi:membrane-associated phospholipid phosphatase